MKTLFISKSEDQLSVELKQFCIERKIELIAHSFLQFSLINAVLPPNFDAVFFGSPRAVDFYLQQFDISESIQLACIGSGTKAHLEKRGYRVDFHGKEAGNPDEVARNLKNWLGEKTLLVARSTISNQSVAKQIPAKQLFDVVVYHTEIVPRQLKTTVEILVFTSPSNVSGYISKNEILPTQKIIAWGKTTAKKMIQLGLMPDFTLKNASENELIAWLNDFIPNN